MRQPLDFDVSPGQLMTQVPICSWVAAAATPAMPAWAATRMMLQRTAVSIFASDLFRTEEISVSVCG